jgi:hypothetical protein
MARSGRDGISTRISLDGGDEVKRQLAELGKTGEKALADLSAATQGASTNLALVSNVSRDLQAVFGRLGGLSAVGAGAFSSIAGAAAGMTTGLGATIAVVAAATTALGALAVSGAHAASEIKEGATRVGVSADDYTKLKFAFEQSGSSAESFEKAMAIILDAAGDAGKAAEKAAAEVEAANEAIKKSSEAAGEEARKRAIDTAQSILDTRRALATDLANIDIQEGRALRALTEQPLTERAAIERRFREQREDAARAAAERIKEIERKAALEAAEAARKRQKEEADQRASFDKAQEESARKAANAFEKLGVSLLDATGNARDPAGVFRDIAEAIGKIEDPAQRSAKTIELFKRRVGTQLVESLSAGRVGLDDLAKEAERLGLVFSAADLKIGKSFSDTILKLGNTIGATSAKVGLAFAGMFDGVGEALAASLGRAQPAIVAFAQSIAILIKPIFDDITNLIAGDIDKINSQFIRVLIPTVQVFGQGLLILGQIVGGVFTVLNASFAQIAGLINDVFGTKVTAGDIPAFIAAIYLIVTAMGALRAAFVAIGLTPFGLLLTAIAGIAAALLLLFGPTQQISELIGKVFGPDAKAAFDTFVANFREAGAQLLAYLKDQLLTLFDNLWKGAIERVTAYFQPLIDLLGSIGNLLSALFAKAGDLGNKVAEAVANAPPTPVLARGGLIRGAGTGTSDSILARLSDYEFVNTARAVRFWGPAVFEALNRLQNPFKGFSLGGLVQGLSQPLIPTPRFAAGGLVTAASGPSGTAFTLVIDNRPFDVSAPSDVAEQLFRFARQRAMLSAGRKPGGA